MKKIYFAVVALTLVACGASFRRQVVNSVVDIALAACVAENSSESMAFLHEACGFGQDMEPVIRKLIEANVSGSRKASAKLAASLQSDAGTVKADH